jgi:hypothetical protein
MTKSKPNRHRQPAKPASPGRGRRRLPLREHPDRYALACIDAMAWLFDSERIGARLGTFYAIGVPGKVNDEGTHLVFAYPSQRRTSVKKLAECARNLRRWYRSDDDIKWRTRAGEAFLLAHIYSQHPDPAKRRWAAETIMLCAAEIGETDWARLLIASLLNL